MIFSEGYFIDYIGLIGNDTLNFAWTKEEQEQVDKLYEELRKLAIKYMQE